MKRFIKVFVTLLIGLSAFSVKAQHAKQEIKLPYLMLQNKEFSEILDSFYQSEKKCSYYSSKLLFAIDIQKLEKSEHYFITIESLADTNLALGLPAPRGYFIFKNHLVFVYDTFGKNLFSISAEKKVFTYIDYTKEKSGSPNVVNTYNDDSFSIWAYWLVNDKFILQGKSLPCK